MSQKLASDNIYFKEKMARGGNTFNYRLLKLTALNMSCFAPLQGLVRGDTREMSSTLDTEPCNSSRV